MIYASSIRRRRGIASGYPHAPGLAFSRLSTNFRALQAGPRLAWSCYFSSPETNTMCLAACLGWRISKGRRGSRRTVSQETVISDSSAPSPRLHLRGGAWPRRRLGDDERVPATLWWFAGGMGKPPTGKQLRAMKKRKREMERKRQEARAARRQRGGFFQRLKDILIGKGRSREGSGESGQGTAGGSTPETVAGSKPASAAGNASEPAGNTAEEAATTPAA